jgi:hypothetical protein
MDVNFMKLKYIKLTLLLLIVFLGLTYNSSSVSAVGSWYCIDDVNGTCATGFPDQASCQTSHPGCIGPFPGISACTMNCLPF